MTRLLTAVVVFALFAGVTLLLLRPRDTRVAPVGPYAPLVTTPAAVPALRAALGTSACTSSGCHAGTPGEGEPWRSAYSVWALHDPHSRAERVLHGELAARIVAGIAAVDRPLSIVPAAENRACTGCHAPLAAPPAGGVEGAIAGADPRAAEGVSCEACHGPAGDWLVAHTLPGWRQSIEREGMLDLGDPSVAAARCGECHVGSPPTDDGRPRQVTHALIAAGHPRLAFDLRAFRAGLPSHWRDPAAFADRAAAEGGRRAEPIEEWSLGRLAVLRAYLVQAERQSVPVGPPPADGSAPAWPEFTAFDCYGCHRPALSAGALSAPSPGIQPIQPPGIPRPDPLVWALLESFVPAEAYAAVEGARDALAARWMDPPALDTFQGALAAIDRGMPGAADRLRALPPGEQAAAIAAAADLRAWGEAAVALAALEAVVAQAGSGDRVAAELAALKDLLAFPIGEGPDGPIRHDSPHPYDPAAAAAAVERIVAGIQAGASPP